MKQLNFKNGNNTITATINDNGSLIFSDGEKHGITVALNDDGSINGAYIKAYNPETQKDATHRIPATIAREPETAQFLLAYKQAHATAPRAKKDGATIRNTAKKMSECADFETLAKSGITGADEKIPAAVFETIEAYWFRETGADDLQAIEKNIADLQAQYNAKKALFDKYTAITAGEFEKMKNDALTLYNSTAQAFNEKRKAQTATEKAADLLLANIDKLPAELLAQLKAQLNA